MLFSFITIDGQRLVKGPQSVPESGRGVSETTPPRTTVPTDFLPRDPSANDGLETDSVIPYNSTLRSGQEGRGDTTERSPGLGPRGYPPPERPEDPGTPGEGPGKTTKPKLLLLDTHWDRKNVQTRSRHVTHSSDILVLSSFTGILLHRGTHTGPSLILTKSPGTSRIKSRRRRTSTLWTLGVLLSETDGSYSRRLGPILGPGHCGPGGSRKGR